MNIQLTINGEEQALTVQPGELLLHTLRKAGYYGVKHGCETGECGACAVDPGRQAGQFLYPSGRQADGGTITTIEGLAPEEPAKRGRVDPIQQAFVETGAIQCGYCTPAQILAAKALLEANSEPHRGRGARGAGRRALPLHGICQAGRGCAASRGRAARREEQRAGWWASAIPMPPGLLPPAEDLPEPIPKCPSCPIFRVRGPSSHTHTDDHRRSTAPRRPRWSTSRS